MDYIVIDLPQMNDSFSRVSLSGTAYYIRMTYNDTGGYWMFGLYDARRQPIIEGVRVVNDFPLNAFCSDQRIPSGVFGVIGSEPGHDSFITGASKLVFMPGGGTN